MAPIYLKNKSDHHTEKQMLCAAVLGHELDRWGQPTDITFDFFRAKGLLDSALAGLRLDYKYVETSNSDTSAEVTYGFSNSILVCHKGETFGVIGDVRADIANEFGIEIPVTLIDIDTAVLIQALNERNIPHIGGNTPVVEHDISVIVDKATPANNLIEIIESAPLVKRVEIFDIYEGEPFNENEKSVSVRIQWQAPDRTLTGGEVQKFLAKILKNIKQQTGGIMRT
jgi:phenylalanyl-tRNA synthetase beta chain